MAAEMLRLVEAMHQEKEIDKEVIFQALEAALQTAAKKKYRNNDVIVTIDRITGEISASTKDGESLTPPDFGRIAAQSAKQQIIQKIREAERDVIYTEYEQKKRKIAVGHIVRQEHGALVVNLGKVEGVLPPQEQVSGEYYHPGDRIRCYVLDVKKIGHRVKIILSRTHPNFIRKLFELEVPEIAQEIIEINSLVREAGYRTKIAVSSQNSKIDCVGACIGVRGARIRNIIEELGNEKIDIIRWDTAPDVLISNALKPAEISHIVLDDERKRAKVFVPTSQQPLAIGKDGQNVRLAARLCKWDIDILTLTESSGPGMKKPETPVVETPVVETVEAPKNSLENHKIESNP